MAIFPPMSATTLCYIVDQTPVVAFLEILHPDSGFGACLKRVSNAQATILLLSKAICNACQVPFDESVKCLCEHVVDEHHFWNQCIKYLTESTFEQKKPSKSKLQNDESLNDVTEIWDCVTELCQTITNHEILFV